CTSPCKRGAELARWRWPARCQPRRESLRGSTAPAAVGGADLVQDARRIVVAKVIVLVTSLRCYAMT
ncbi:hypothetical protein, partial [Xanthomonas euvesicatoria]|uniref:hypothetical protein n=1 Tax=Xanthomonas euvesicatoria TaxID=456327 RepID=UPI001C47D55A